MGIVDEDIALVRQRADIVEVANQFMQLKRVGRRWAGLCPFHGEKTPSFSINAEEGLYYCFGCQAKGDTIRLVEELQHLTFVEAIEWLAHLTGVTLRYTDRAEGEGRKRKAQLATAVESAVEWYHQRLLTGTDAGPARGYLRQRGFDGESVRRYRLGYAPDAWDALARHLGLSDKVLTETGLGFVNKARRQQDFFRDRVLFPIFDPQGGAIGFGGRVLPGGEGPKYRNTSQTTLYDKSRVLYGLNWAKSDASKADEVIICEGYTDVIGFADAGVPRAVATCGTSLTEEHVRLLKRFARRFVLAFDPDAAGAAAAERVYEWEKRHDLEVVVADLPSGRDPGDLARDDPDRLREAVAEPLPFLGFRVERALAGVTGTSPEANSRRAQAALEVIREHPDEFVRDQYVVTVADRCRLDVERLRGTLRRKGAKVQLADPRPTRRRSGELPELSALRLATDAETREAMLPLLHEVLFQDGLHAAAYRALAHAGGDLHRAIEDADPEAGELLQRLATEDESGDPADVRRVLLRTAGQLEMKRLRAEYADTRDDTISHQTTWLGRQLDAVKPDGRPERTVEDQLLGWLAARAEERP